MKSLQTFQGKKRTFLLAAMIASALSITGCSGADKKPQQTASVQPASSGAEAQSASSQQTANQSDEQKYKAACKEMELRDLKNNYNQYINKQVHAVGPVTELQELQNNKIRVKIQYPDTDAVWVTADKPMISKPKVGKRVEFWGVMRGIGEKSKLPEINAPYFKVL